MRKESRRQPGGLPCSATNGNGGAVGNLSDWTKAPILAYRILQDPGAYADTLTIRLDLKKQLRSDKMSTKANKIIDQSDFDDDVDACAVVGEVVHEITVVARRYRERGLDVSGRYLARVGLLIPGGADDEHAASVERFDDGFERSRPHAGFDAQRQRHNGGDIARLDHALDPLESGDERR